MKYKVFARSWADEHDQRFGSQGSVHEIPDSDFPGLIRQFGRIELEKPAVAGEPESLWIQNDYD